MTNGSGDQTSITRKEVFDSYLIYCSSAWFQGNCKVCKDTQVTDRAKHVLLAEDNPEARFSVLPFYPILSECVGYTGKDCRNCVSRFIKFAEMLETLCVNLFLFPWKKEIKILKTFTGHFVYNIKPVLPQETTRSILQRIGYSLENDMEYKMLNHVDLDVVKVMGFELLLARLECEYLLEVMGERSHAECLKILCYRATPNPGWCVGTSEDQPTTEAHNVRQEGSKEDGVHDGSSLLNPGSPQDQNALQNIKPSILGAQEIQDTPDCAEGRPSQAFMSDDRSILEMRKNYPDLAFRQKPIFTKPQSTPRNKEWARDPTGVQEYSTDMSGPQSITLHAGGTEMKELTEKLGKWQIKDLSADEPLKYPTEETTQGQQFCSCRDYAAASPVCSPTEKNQPLLSSPSQEPSCSLSSCGNCSRTAAELPQDDPIKEPPHSFYIPNCLSGCSPAVAPPTDHQEELQPTEQWSHCL